MAIEFKDVLKTGSAAGAAIVDRLDFLRTPEDDDDDVPLSESAALGFLEFLERIERPRIEPSLTTTRGWLCSTWRFGEGGPVLVIWFKDCSNTMLTTLPRGSGIPGDIGQDPRSQNAATLVELLDEHRIFSRRTVDNDLPVGEPVDMVVSQSPASERRSIVDILDEAPGHLVFTSAADVAAYLAEEKDAWGR